MAFEPFEWSEGPHRGRVPAKPAIVDEAIISTH